MRLLGLLPARAGLLVGAVLGMVAFHVLRQRRRVTEVNLRLCFPEMDAAQRAELARAAFASAGIGLVEIGWSWWGPPAQLPLRISGQACLDAALARGRGVVLLGAHYTSLELGGRHFRALHAVDTLYRPHDNPLLDWMITRCRSRFCLPIERRDFRQVQRSLRANHVVWCALDQDFGRSNAVFTPFFGQPAATLTMASRLARLNDSSVLFLRHQREGAGYVLELTPLDNFPGTSPEADALRFNQLLEQAIRCHPEQYLWMHKRFKTQPDGNQKLYRAAGC